MKKFILCCLWLVLLSCPALAVQPATALTNKALWEYDDGFGHGFTNRTSVASHYFKIVVVTPGFDPAKPSPLAGDTIHIPITVQNVGSLDMAAGLRLGAGLTSNWGSVTITTDRGTPKVFDSQDTNAIISVIAPLASGQGGYYWLNITLRSNLPQGGYGYVLTNLCLDPAFPLAIVYSNSIDSFMQNVTVMSACDGARAIRNFDGTGLLSDLDVTVHVAMLPPPASAWLYYDVDKVPDGSTNFGTLTNNRRAPLIRKNGIWTAKIPGDDPEIVGGKQVNFIVVADGRKYLYSAAVPFSYFVNEYASQPQETDSPVTVANNVGNFGEKPVRLIYGLARDGFVNITVYDLRGGMVRNVKNEKTSGGRHVDGWDGLNDQGNEVAEGLYFLAIETPEYSVRYKLLLVRH